MTSSKVRAESELTLHQQQEARRRIANGEPTRYLAKSYGVSISTMRLAA